MRALKILVIVMTFAAMLFVWPIHPFREVGNVRSGDEGHARTNPIGEGESISQRFAAADNNIIQIEFVLSCDDMQPRSGELLFELLDRDGEAVYAETLDYAGVPDYSYGGPVVNVRVRKGRPYTVRLTNLNVSENQPCAVYTTDVSGYCLKKGALEVAGEPVEGEWLTRITTNRPITAENTLAIWGCIGMVGFDIYEVLVRREKRRAAQEKEG